MSCSNCYNGCPQIVSDQCVKYTGIDVPVLGIKNGDSLSYVEQAIITFLTSTLDGTGVKPKVEPSIICDIVKKYLPTCGDLSVVDFIKALIQAVCELKPLVDGTIADIDDINDFIASLEAAYDVDCLTGVTSTSGTHLILQAVIDRLCAFIIDVDATYVKLDDLDDLIAAYLGGQPGSSKYYTKMVPYVAVPFFPTVGILSNFSGSGVGSGDWEKIYFCNGLNGTPDLRGRVPVGVTTGMGGSALSPIVAPGGLNPDYQLNTITGANGVFLSEPQLPSHTHTATATSTSTGTISPDPHSHSFTYTGRGATTGSSSIGSSAGSSTKTTSSQSLSVSITTSTTVNNANTGGNEAHSNVQPGVGCYYIMYIP
jgi:microcystin-dependent protein